MTGLDHLDPLAFHPMAVGGDDLAGNPVRRVVLHRARHGRGRLAGADDDETTGMIGPRQVGGDTGFGLDGIDGVIEQPP